MCTSMSFTAEYFLSAMVHTNSYAKGKRVRGKREERNWRTLEAQASGVLKSDETDPRDQEKMGVMRVQNLGLKAGKCGGTLSHATVWVSRLCQRPSVVVIVTSIMIFCALDHAGGHWSRGARGSSPLASSPLLEISSLPLALMIH